MHVLFVTAVASLVIYINFTKCKANYIFVMHCINKHRAKMKLRHHHHHHRPPTTTTTTHSDKKRIHTMAATTTYSRYRGMHVLQTALVMLAIICSWYVFSRDVIDFDNISTICNCRFVFNINFEILSIVYLITSQVEILT